MCEPCHIKFSVSAALLSAAVACPGVLERWRWSVCVVRDCESYTAVPGGVVWCGVVYSTGVSVVSVGQTSLCQHSSLA